MARRDRCAAAPQDFEGDFPTDVVNDGFDVFVVLAVVAESAVDVGD
jgi:hypothetical protein